MILSGYWIVTGQILIGFLSMTAGYVIIAALWLTSWNRRAETSNPLMDTQMPPVKVLPPTASKVRPHNILTVQQSRVGQELVASAIDLGHSTATHWHSVDCAPSHHTPPPDSPASAESSRSLHCSDCNKRFNVRGQGELSVRLIPCPHCGVALQRANGEQPRTRTNEPAWAPIISVYCGHCHGLIDVPYGSIGTTISCPRCYADLPVPDTEL